MRILLFISLLFLSNLVFSQAWQDALKNAREYYVSKSYDQSVSNYRTAQKLAPKNIDLSVELAQALYKSGKYDEAEKLYKSQINKNQGKVANSDIHRQLGDSRMHQQKYGQAIEAYKSSLRSNPSDEVARHNLSKAIQQKQEKDNPEKKKDNPNQNTPDSKDTNPKPDEDQQAKNPQEKPQQANDPSPKEKENKQDPSMSDKRTERLLEELSKKEKETKRHMNSNIDDKSKVRNKVKKDW